MKYELKNKTIELTDEEVQEIINKFPEEKTVGLEIKNRFTGEVIYTSTKTTYKDAVEEAVEGEASLREADLCEANLCEANLRRANLGEANLDGANLYGANLYEANLYGANLYGANLSRADLQNAKFFGRGGETKISKSQVNNFFEALGVVVTD